MSRVAIDITPLLYPGGGIRRCTQSLLNALANHTDDLNFTLFGRRLGGDTFKGPRWPMKRLRLPRSAESFIGTLGLVEKLCRADLYHATDFYMPLRQSGRAIATVHDLIFLSDPEPIVDHQRLQKRAGPFARTAKAIIACSQWTKDQIVHLLHLDPAKIHVVYWGVDAERFHPEPDEQRLRVRLADSLGLNRPYFLAVSCSVHRKNTPRLLSAFRALLRQGTNHDLVVVWSPPPQILQAFEPEIAQGRIRFTGRVDDSQLRDLYAGATATIYPSLSEGFGLPMLESMSCGTPVIAANTSCLPEIAGDAAVYIDPMSEHEMTAAMAGFESGSIDRAARRRNGLARAQSFTWQRCAQQTVEVYRHALGAMSGSAA